MAEVLKFSIKEIKTYIEAQESRGDILYYLSEENILKANEKEDEEDEEDEEEDIYVNCNT